MDELLAAVRRRVTLYTITGSPVHLLGQAATDEGFALWEAATRTGESGLRTMNIEPMAALAWFHWCRFWSLPDGVGDAERATAESLFDVIAPEWPELVPEILIADTELDDWCDEGTDLLERCLGRDDPAALDRAISLFRQVLQMIDIERSSRGDVLNNLGMALRLRSERGGGRQDLDDAVLAGEVAVECTPAGPERALYAANLGARLQARYLRDGDEADLNGAVDTIRIAVDGLHPAAAERAGHLSNLGLALRMRFERFGVPADIDEAVTVGRAALERCPPGHSNRVQCLGNLSGSLQVRFGWRGDPADLDEAVASVREALWLVPGNHPDLGRHLSNLTVMLQTRYASRGDRADLDAAVEAARGAERMVPGGHANRAQVLSYLAAALAGRFERLRNRVDVDEAVAIGRAALDLAPDADPGRPMYLSHLATALDARYADSGDPDDLDAALAAARAAVSTAPVDHPYRARYLTNLAGVLLRRAERSGEARDLDAVIAAAEAIVDVFPAGHPDRSTVLANLGISLRARFLVSGSGVDADRALHMWREGAASRTAPAATRLRCADAFGDFAASLERWPEAAEGLTAAVRLLPLSAWRGLSRAGAEDALVSADGVARDAGACTIAADDPRGAVVALEAGRAVGWAQLLDTRTDLSRLRSAVPELAARLGAVRSGLDRPAA
ncbi:hypothetical protein Dvina_17350 [Dactylosporangium vinaceum]|uniref:Tetratricopeptide repeat protein n=1 Tax=Dactylosporangium vinaceum TaxID=53362 RepID=A0ABV5M3I5_9ACTN|nr:hypothetical protein [Dactylosporangium vinaceum]UAB99676.1 hypothetical protein Dvina_17350 [Dactylosporangium vinaceum]